MAKLNFQEQLTASRGSLVYVVQVSLRTSERKCSKLKLECGS